MFDVAPTELLLVVVVALVVIGPKDLPKAMRFVGKWVGPAIFKPREGFWGRVFDPKRVDQTHALMERYGPRRLGREALRGLRALSTSAADLPGQIHTILDDLRGGKLELVARDPALATATDRLGRRVFTAVIATELT